jgi:hypothetical protein
MKPGSRLVLPLVSAGVLLIAALAVMFWPAPSVSPVSKEPEPVAVAAPVAVAPAVPAPRAQPAPAPAPVSTPAPVSQPAEGPATEVPLQPGDVVPEPEREGPPQENDPIEPEKPQTARWKLAKTERISTLLGRDVERLERERERAESRGDAQEVQRLGTLIKRHRQHQEKLRKDLEQLAEAAKNEPPEP